MFMVALTDLDGKALEIPAAVLPPQALAELTQAGQSQTDLRQINEING